MYLMVLEVVLLGFVVLVVAPILFVSHYFSSSFSAETLMTELDILEYLPNLHWAPSSPKPKYDQT